MGLEFDLGKFVLDSVVNMVKINEIRSKSEFISDELDWKSPFLAAEDGSEAEGFVKLEEEWAMWTASPLHHANRSPEGEKQKHWKWGKIWFNQGY